MKPLQLSMTAFGPYKEREVIDFEKLEGHHLFVISGATGAGKTTIFDAICFALYGTASGSDRENTAMLRSHFAEDHVHTAVEFVFELNGRKYRVLRQLGHVKKGNKSKTGDRYEFYELLDDGEAIPSVDRQNVSEINKKIEELIGLSEDQFKQIVMLPQGEFRKLLTSETENKEDILRRIFKTERYRHMNDILKSKKDDLNERFKSEEHFLDHHVKSISTLLVKRENSPLFNVLEQDVYNTDQVVSGLSEEATYLNNQIQANESKYHQSVEQFEQKQHYYFQAKATNEKFAELDQKRAEKEKLQQEKVFFLQKENQIKLAEQALHLEPYEKQVNDRRVELANKKREAEIAAQQLERAKVSLEESKGAYDEEEKKEERRDALKRNLERFVEFLPIVKQLNEKKTEIVHLENEIQKKTFDISRLSQSIDNDTKQVDQLKIEISSNEKELSRRGEKEKLRYELLHKYTIFKKYNELKQKEYHLEKEMKEKEVEFSQAEKHYREYETIWLENQAVVMATHLQNGDPCPVCGSTHHPDKKLAADGVSREELDKRKEIFETKEKSYREIYSQYSSILNQLKEQSQEVSNFDVALEDVRKETEVVVEQGKKVKQEIEQLEQVSKQVESMRVSVTEMEIKIKENREMKEKLEKYLQEIQTKYTKIKTTVTEQTRQIPDAIQDLDTLQKKMKQVSEEKELLEKRWIDVQKQFELAKEEHTKAQVNVINSHKQVEEIELILRNIEKTFKEKLLEAGFDSEQKYMAAKLPLEARQQLETEIERYKQQVVNVQQRIEELTNELTEKERKDLTKLEIELQQLKQVRDQAFEQLTASKKYYDAALSLKKNIVEVQQTSETIEKQLAIVTDLYDVLRGQNWKKISFERYLQIDYLDQITNAANERFRLLTNGQFHLIRSDRQESYGKQSGLAIDVYDSYTGQTRDVKTLSGGEKFIASLCLALGMSDVIQSFQGSISIDTMFIDEGFGSLDEESLHKSIDALVSLQQTGRMIGVISHVDELKSMFPAMLEVKKTKEGHSRAQFILK